VRLFTSPGRGPSTGSDHCSQLASDKLELQLGGIYGLELIAKESESNRLQVFEVLTAYVRQHARQGEADTASLSSLDDLEVRKPDVQAVMRVLGRREVNSDDPPLNLRKVDLRKSDLQRAKLQRARLDGAWLQGANLNDAQLEGVRLQRARLQGTRLTSAKQLEAAELGDAQSNARTLWPKRFDWRAAGVKLQED
jgi:hypothetical protein